MKNASKLIIFIFTFLVLSASAYAQMPREELQQMVEQLQKSPDDNALREKIITLAATLKPALVVPPEAKRPFVMAATYQKEAKKPSDFALAISAYQDALKIAPWWGDAYYNLSVSLESAGRLDEAKDALEHYLLTKPKDAEEAQNRLFALEAKKNLAAKQAADAEASVRSWFCRWYPSDAVGGTLLTIDSARRVVTYVERGTDGKEKPSIVSTPDIAEAEARWTQTETFQNGHTAQVSYRFNTSSGGLDYTYAGSGGDARRAQLSCVSIATRR